MSRSFTIPWLTRTPALWTSLTITAFWIRGNCLWSQPLTLCRSGSSHAIACCGELTPIVWYGDWELTPLTRQAVKSSLGPAVVIDWFVSDQDFRRAGDQWCCYLSPEFGRGACMPPRHVFVLGVLSNWPSRGRGVPCRRLERHGRAPGVRPPPAELVERGARIAVPDRDNVGDLALALGAGAMH